MVQNDPWPTVSPEVADLFRQGAEAALRLRAEWVEELHAASLSGARMRAVAEDPGLANAVRRTNLANVLQWVAANVQHPGRRVPAHLGPEQVEAARDLVRRGLDETALDAYRTAQAIAWRRWMGICFDLTSDPALLRELLDVSALSITTFIEDTVRAVSERVEAERAELTRGSHAERRATVGLLLEGAPISRARAEAQLGYRLSGPHTAAIIWSTAAEPGQPGQPGPLEAAAEGVMRLGGAGHRLTVVAGAAALWIWVPAATAPPADQLAAALAGHPGVRVAVGRPGTDVDGFRRSHLDAVATQHMLTRLTSPQQAARYEDVQLVALLTADPAAADEFVTETLGALRRADPEIRDAVLTYVREQGSTARTAERLFTHRNTVVRRLARADELLPRPLAGNALAVAAALDVLRWQG